MKTFTYSPVVGGDSYPAVATHPDLWCEVEVDTLDQLRGLLG